MRFEKLEHLMQQYNVEYHVAGTGGASVKSNTDGRLGIKQRENPIRVLALETNFLARMGKNESVGSERGGMYWNRYGPHVSL
ncbi:MAG: hypothetical protein ABW185_00525 [Sedimenticola sp.]